MTLRRSTQVSSAWINRPSWLQHWKQQWRRQIRLFQMRQQVLRLLQLTLMFNTVAEAAKSSSTSAASLSFSMNRLSTGMYAFLYACSVNIKDEDTFGSEAAHRLLSTTGWCRVSMMWRMRQSLVRLLSTQRTSSIWRPFGSIDWWTSEWQHRHWRMDEKGCRVFSSDQNNSETPWRRTLPHCQPMVLTAEQGFGVPDSHSFANGSAANQEIVRSAIQRLSAKGDAYKHVIETSEGRLASIYY